MSDVHADEVAIDDATVHALVADQFPAWADEPLVRLPPVGTDNQLFRLGASRLVRLPRVAYATAAADWELTWLPRLAPHLGLTVPTPLGLGRPGAGYPWPWTVVPWIEGDTPTQSTLDPDAWAAGLGTFVRQLREVPAMDGPVNTTGRGAPLATFDEWVRTWTARADPSAVDPDAVLAVWRDALDAPAWPGEPAWLHGDLHAGNLLARDGKLVAVIDWGGSAGRGDPAVELNAMWSGLPASSAELYRATVGLDDAAYRRGRGFALAPAISGWTYYRKTAPRLSDQFLRTVQALIASL